MKPVHHWLPARVMSATIRAGLVVVSGTRFRLSAPRIDCAAPEGSGPIAGTSVATGLTSDRPGAPSVPRRLVAGTSRVRPSLVTVAVGASRAAGGAAGGGAWALLRPPPTMVAVTASATTALATVAAVARIAPGWTRRRGHVHPTLARRGRAGLSPLRPHPPSPTARGPRYTTAAMASASWRRVRTS